MLHAALLRRGEEGRSDPRARRVALRSLEEEHGGAQGHHQHLARQTPRCGHGAPKKMLPPDPEVSIFFFGPCEPYHQNHGLLFWPKKKPELGPVLECRFYCLLHFESLVKCKMYPKSTPENPGFKKGRNPRTMLQEV